MAVKKQKITPFLWFDNNAEEALRFYTSIFKRARIRNISRYGEGAPMPKGTIMSATFELEGQEFMALNGGPRFKFTEAISFFVKCKDQKEVDFFWEKLSAGGEKSRCGWLKDRYGLWWQIIPGELGKLLGGKDPERTQRVMGALMQMDKIDLKILKHAYAKR